jgi:hypothetical protein
MIEETLKEIIVELQKTNRLLASLLPKDKTFKGKDKLLSVRQFAETHKAFTIGALRHLIFFEETNGLKEHKVLKRLGRKILIDVEKFFQWVELPRKGNMY